MTGPPDRCRSQRVVPIVQDNKNAACSAIAVILASPEVMTTFQHALDARAGSRLPARGGRDP